MAVPDRIQDLRVALVGYRDTDGGVRVARVDVIDVQALRSLTSLSPADAVALAHQLNEVAGWAAPATEPGS